MAENTLEGKSFEGNSIYGHWMMKEDLPVFNYTANPLIMQEAEWHPLPHPKTRRHYHFIGNRAVSFLIDNLGTSSMWDELECNRWLTKPDHQEGGTGFSIIEEEDGTTWSTQLKNSPDNGAAGKNVPERHFGPFFYSVHGETNGLRFERDMIMPEGDAPWAFVRVRLSLAADQPTRRFKLSEEWALKPLYVALLMVPEDREELAEEVTYELEINGAKVKAQEDIDDADFAGSPATMMIESLNKVEFTVSSDEALHPTITLSSDIVLESGETKEFYFRFGRFDETPVEKPETFYQENFEATKARLPKAHSSVSPLTTGEISWHAAALYGMMFKDGVLGEYTINQGCSYGFDIGINGAARDPYQFAVPLLYTEPKMCKAVMRNTNTWCSPDGDVPFTLTSNKEASNMAFRPSDQNLWALWLAAEYAAFTGDLGAFSELQPYHPDHEAEAVTLKEHLIRQFRFFMDEVGRGAGNHVRILNADWQDDVLDFAGDYNKEQMIESGGSVFNSALAAFVLPMFAGLMDKLGEPAIAKEARTEADDLRELVSKSHNGSYFWRAIAPDGSPIGDDRCWIEVQAFALLCGAASPKMVDNVLKYVDEHNAKDSPLGARTMHPHTGKGRASQGGIWYTINEKLIWGAARNGRQDWAWKHLEMMSNHTKTEAYPNIWEGVLSGPDAWNAPESKIVPGSSWEGWDVTGDDGTSGVDANLIEVAKYMSMQAFPVCNAHAHTNPILGYVHILGLEVTPECTLRVGKGGYFESQILCINEDGSGWIKSDHEITIESVNGKFTGKGIVKF